MQKTDILLIRPNSGIPTQTAPLGLGYLAADLRNNRINVAVKDCLCDNLSVEQTADLVGISGVKIVGIGCCTNEARWTEQLAKDLKAIPGITIIVGGPHPSCVMEEIYNDIPAADFSVYSEGEGALPLLVKAILESDLSPERLAGIPNLIWKNGAEIIKNRHELIQDLDKIAFPAWDLIDIKRYSRKVPHGFLYRAAPFAPMIATRGCPYGCSFCGTANIHGKKIRMRSPGNIISEIECLAENYGVKEIFFEDDNFTFDEAFVLTVCEKIMRLRRKIFFSLPNGICIDKVTEELLRAMRRAGFYSFAVGIESGSRRILEKMHKRIDLAEIKEKIAAAKKIGFNVTGFFIIGHPGETPEDIEATIEYSKKIKIDKASFSKFFPLPGTESYNELAKESGAKRRYHFDALGAKDIPYSPEGITPEELRRYIRKAVRSFYFRPSIIFRNMFQLRFSHLFQLLRMYRRFV